MILVFLLTVLTANAAIYQHGAGRGNGGNIHHSTGARPQPSSPARPGGMRPGPGQPRRVPGAYPAGGGYYEGTAPYVSGVDVEDGKIRGYHVVSPAVFENPFGGLQGTVNQMRAPASSGSSEPENLVVRRYKLAPPSTEEAMAKEEGERVLFQGTERLAQLSVSFTEEQLRKQAMDLLKDAYWQNGRQLLQAYTYAISKDGIAKTPANTAFPPASEGLLLEAFRAGVALQVVRSRPVRVSCGLCDGSGKIPVERVVVDDKERIVTGTCPRCDGQGKRPAEIEALYTIRVGGKTAAE